MDLCRECGNAEMADSKNLKDDPLVIAASIIKHRGSKTSVKVTILDGLLFKLDKIFSKNSV